MTLLNRRIFDTYRLPTLSLLVLGLAGGCDGCFHFGDGRGEGCAGDDDIFEDGPCLFCDPCTCPDGSFCVDRSECFDPPKEECGGHLCSSFETCWFGACVVEGETCATTGDCASGFTCEYGDTDYAGASEFCPLSDAVEGHCMPAPEDCPGDAGTCLEACELELDVTTALDTPVASWGSADIDQEGDSVVSAPVLGQLDDDDCSGVVDWRDEPEVIFVTAAVGVGETRGRVVVATRRLDGTLEERWSATAEPPSRNDWNAELATARTSSGAYVVACTTDGRLRAYDGAGVERWLSEPIGACHAPAIADLDGNGPRVVAEGGIVSLLDGAVVTTFAPPLSGPPLIADVAASPGNEILDPTSLRDAAGALLASVPATGSFVATADLDGDLAPEIVAVDSTAGRHHLLVWRLDATGAGEVVRSDVDLHAGLADPCMAGDPGADAAGGPPAVADFNGDGSLDVAVAGSRAVVVFDGPRLADGAVPIEQAIRLVIPRADCAGGRRGASAFDFDADGAAEVVVSDATSLAVLSALDGTTLWTACNPSEPTSSALPIADADGDGSADIVAFASSRLGGGCEGEEQAGVRLFGHGARAWAGAPRVWTQHQASGSGLLYDGSAPAGAIAPGSLRSPQVGVAAPSLAVERVADCEDDPVARVRNHGRVPLLPGTVFVRFHTTLVTLPRVPIEVPIEAGGSTLIEAPESQTDQDWTATLERFDGTAFSDCHPENDEASCD